MLTVVTTSTADCLVSLADLKDALDITDAGKDETLKRFLRRATGRIESYCGRTFFSQRYRAVIPSYGGFRLQLPAYPITAVHAVYDGTDTGSAIERTDYNVDYARGWVTFQEDVGWSVQSYPEVSPFPEPLSEQESWIVDFTAGYVPPDGATSTGDGTTATGSTVPYDLQEAAISLVRSRFLSRTREQGITSKSVGELSISYGQGAAGGTDLPPDVLALLAPYRSLA